MPPDKSQRRSSDPRKSPGGYKKRLSSDKTRFAAFCFLVACVFAMGGGSRADIMSLPILRPLAFFVGSYALLVARPGELRRVAWPLNLLAALAALMLCQLVPLPESLWSQLPGRGLYVKIAADAGIPLGSRPLTLSPSRTLNALFSLVVPLAAVLIFAVQGSRWRPRVWTVLLIACATSAVVAIAQIASPGNGALYLYKITNNDFPVGLFANRNHQALLMAILLLLLTQFSLDPQRPVQLGTLPIIGLAFAGLVVFALILVTGSRAGLLLGALIIPAAVSMHARANRGVASFEWNARRKWAAAAFAGALLVLVGVALALSRASSIQRLWSDGALSDYRLDQLPMVLAMLRDHWLSGIGFGAFEGAFMRYETLAALSPFTFNAAHDDWLQFPLEGGLPATILLVVAIFWLARESIGLVRQWRSGIDVTRTTAVLILVLIAAASTVDYPLRTPIFMLIGAIAVSHLVGGRFKPTST
jgi:hypothetical protein